MTSRTPRIRDFVKEDIKKEERKYDLFVRKIYYFPGAQQRATLCTKNNKKEIKIIKMLIKSFEGKTRE